MDPRSPQMSMFEVDPIQGVLDRDGSRPHYPDIVEVSPYGKSFVESNFSAAAMATDYPSMGFGLKLHIFYSKSFKNKLGSGTKSKYEVVLVFENNFYLIFKILFPYLHRIDTIMGHSKTIMTWSSLDAKMVLSYDIEYLENEMYFSNIR